MPMSYYKTFKVPCWVVIDNKSKSNEIKEWFKEREARIQDWPGLNFGKYVEAYKNKGFGYVWEKETPIIPEILVNRALQDLVREEVNPYANQSFDMRVVHRINRMIKSPDDYLRIFNELVNMQDAIVLSQMFQIAEICHDESRHKRPQLWVTDKAWDVSPLTKISESMVTIGNDASYDINVKNVKKDKLAELLEKKVVELFKG